MGGSRKKILIAIMTICLIAFAVSGGIAVYRAVVKHNAFKEYMRLSKLADTEEMGISEETGAAASGEEASGDEDPGDIISEEPAVEGQESEEEDQPKLSDIPGVDISLRDPDWDELKGINDDVYAWLYVPGTNVDYPVVEHETEYDFYLMHNLDKSYGYPGCVYSRPYVDKDMSDPMTILYGHNMGNGTMFAMLHEYEDADFFENNKFVYVYLPDRVIVYEIFAAYAHNDEDLDYHYNFFDPIVMKDYLDGVLMNRDMNAHIRRDTEFTGEDHILTLSTCVWHRPELRWLIQAVKIGEESLENT